jgi:Flp pilus assembly protein TadG
MRKLFQRDRKSRSGTAIIEFAIGSGILMAVFGGTFEFGYTFYIYNNLETAVNNGAKYAALRVYEQTTNTPSACFTSAVQDMVAYADPTGTTTTPVAPGLAPGNVSVTATFNNSVPSQVTVGLSSYTIDSVFARITLTNKPQITYPFLGRYAPGETCSQ